MSATRHLLVGGYTPPMGDGRGIRLVRHDRAAGTLTDAGLCALTESPSYLIQAGATVFAVNETEHGRVTSFRWSSDRGELHQLSVQSTGGAHPCHLALHPSGRVLAAANYTSGSVSLHRVRDEGQLEPLSQLIELAGHGPVADRQESAHAHQVVFDGDDLLVADLGSDRVWRARLDVETATAQLGEPFVLPAGFGPRQIVRVADYLYVLGELSNDLAVFRTSEPGRPVACERTTISPPPAGTLAAALEPGPAAGVAFVSHRGLDRVSVLHWQQARVTVEADFAASGHWPRDARYHDGFLYIANQLSDTLCCQPVDGGGRPAGSLITAEVPAPSSILVMD